MVLGKSQPQLGCPSVTWKYLTWWPQQLRNISFWRMPFLPSLPILKATQSFVEPLSAEGPEHLSFPNNLWNHSPSPSSWIKRPKGSFLAFDSGPELKYLTTLEPQTRAVNEHLLALACLGVSILGTWAWLKPSLYHYTWVTLVNFRTTSNITLPPLLELGVFFSEQVVQCYP